MNTRKSKSQNGDGTHSNVGYKNPPKKYQFKPGKSGNPNGRPKGSRNKQQTLCESSLHQIFLEEAHRKITVREGERTITVSVAKAVMRTIATKAAKGDVRTMKLFTELLDRAESKSLNEHQEMFKVMLEFKQALGKERDAWFRGGKIDPEPLPRPDQIDACPRTGDIRITGPFTDKEINTYQSIQAYQAECEAEIERCEKLIKKSHSQKQQIALKEEIQSNENTIAACEDAIQRFDQITLEFQSPS